MHLLIIVALLSAIVGAGVGWLCRGRVLLAASVCSSIAVIAQVICIVLFGPKIEALTFDYLVGYSIYLIGPFLIVFFFPCVLAGVCIALFAPSLIKRWS